MSVLKNYPEEKFWSKVDKTKSCWNWKGCLRKDGYGHLSVETKAKLPHRISYQLLVGRIPKKLQIDHLCRNRSCVNPKHLELVTIGENVLRGKSFSAINAKKTHCKRGHEFTKENTIVGTKPRGYRRMCKTCNRNYYWNKKCVS